MSFDELDVGGIDGGDRSRLESELGMCKAREATHMEAGELYWQIQMLKTGPFRGMNDGES
jgi:hypothetical protein